MEKSIVMLQKCKTIARRLMPTNQTCQPFRTNVFLYYCCKALWPRDFFSTSTVFCNHTYFFNLHFFLPCFLYFENSLNWFLYSGSYRFFTLFLKFHWVCVLISFLSVQCVGPLCQEIKYIFVHDKCYALFPIKS